MKRNEIQELVNRHTAFTSMLYELMKSLLNSSSVKYHVVESRTKSIESLIEKIERKGIKNVQDEITDVSGVRIILYYQDDVDRITDLIKENFKIDEKNSINKGDLYDSNEFGYLSTHYIVSLDNKRNKLPEWKSFDKLKAEIQVRTVLQHSWASISHELTYKKGYEIPRELQRRLFRLAGLFELADEQFLQIRDEHNKLKETIRKISKTNELETEEINLLTLKYSFSEENEIYNKIAGLAIQSGFLEGGNEISDIYLSEIIRVADLLGLEKIQDVENILKFNINSFKAFFKLLISKSEGDWYGDKSFYNLLALLSLLEQDQLKTFFKNSKWSVSIIELISQTIKQMKD